METLDMDGPGGQVVADAVPEMLSIAEAAHRLGVHEKTLRRWIRSGRITATLAEGPYGPQYQVPATALATAQQVIDVVKVERPTDPMTLALAVAQAVHREHDLLRGQLQADLSELKAELLAAIAERPALPAPALSPEQTRESVSTPTPRRRWWWPFPATT